jgi:ADP-heptose:LPS heptosyltransferase
MSEHVADIGDASLLIGFQLGTSQGSRQWPSSAFARLGKALCVELGARIVVFGTEKEAPVVRSSSKNAMGKPFQ